MAAVKHVERAAHGDPSHRPGTCRPGEIVSEKKGIAARERPACECPGSAGRDGAVVEMHPARAEEGGQHAWIFRIFAKMRNKS